MLKKETSQTIYKLIGTVVEKYLAKAELKPKKTSGNPFVIAVFKDFEPLLHRIHGAKGAFGHVMEKIAEVIAKDRWGKNNVRKGAKIDIELPRNVFQAIDSIINDLSNSSKHPSYKQEKNLVLKACRNTSKRKERHTYAIDMELYDRSKNRYYYLEMKGPDPNTTEVPGAKRKLMTEMAWAYYNMKRKKVDCIFGLYYNNKHPEPYRNPKVLYYFDPEGSQGLKVQETFWNFIGKSNTTFSEILEIFKRYGKNNKKRIFSGFSKLVK